MTLEDLKGLVSGAAEKLTEEWMSQPGQTFPPFRPDQMAALRGVTNILRQDLGDHSAILIPIGDRLMIKVNSSQNWQRQNYSIAHEIGHVLLDSVLGRADTALAERQIASGHKVLERLCDMAAAEILMPKRIYSQYVGRYGLSVDSIGPLGGTFAVSVQAAAIRMGEVTEEECLVTCWHWEHPKLFVKWINRRGQFTNGKASKKSRPFSVNRKSLIYQAFISDISYKGFERVELGDCKGQRYLEAKGFGARERRYVISLVFPGRAKPRASLRKARTGDS